MTNKIKFKVDASQGEENVHSCARSCINLYIFSLRVYYATVLFTASTEGVDAVKFSYLYKVYIVFAEERLMSLLR